MEAVMVPASARRVERNTSDETNRERQAEIEASLRYHATRPREIPARLEELDREWDIERALEANAAAVSLAGLALAAFVDRRFLLLPAGVAGFLLQHAIQGWCPPLPVLRRLGFRTPAEICEERCGLKMLGGEPRSFGGPAPAQWVGQAEEIHEGVQA
jgi:hypothetical protein